MRAQLKVNKCKECGKLFVAKERRYKQTCSMNCAIHRCVRAMDNARKNAEKIKRIYNQRR